MLYTQLVFSKANIIQPIHVKQGYPCCNSTLLSCWQLLLLYLFSLHHAGLTNKLSKLSGVVQEHKQKYKSSLESSQADNTQVHVKKNVKFFNSTRRIWGFVNGSLIRIDSSMKLRMKLRKVSGYSLKTGRKKSNSSQPSYSSSLMAMSAY